MRLIDADKLIEDIKHRKYPVASINSSFVILVNKQQTLNQWVSVKDELPEETEDVLVYFERDAFKPGLIECKKREIGIGWQIEERWYADGCGGVKGIAWMPLPKAPEEE